MRRIRVIVLLLRIWIVALKRPERMSQEQKRHTMRLIRDLAILDGFSPRFSRRRPLRESEALKSPRERGVYRLYLNGRLIYIGGSCVSIRNRILDHYDAMLSDANSADGVLIATLKTGSSEFDWLATPFAGWVEEFYILEFEENAGTIPESNVHRRSNLRSRCFY